MSALSVRLRALPSFPAELSLFDPEDTPAEPMALFVAWLDDAIALNDPAPNATTFITAEVGAPVARVVTLRDVDQVGWHVATRRTGRASTALRADPRTALLWYWNRLGRQVRLMGTAAEGTRADAAADYRARPTADPSVDPETLDWTTWTVRADVVEFWQARHDRAHTRLEYRRTPEGWTRAVIDGDIGRAANS